ncbi:MAG: methyl-accepting chemotaxis protein [Steroidobacteraceae bacterium]
MTNRLDAARLQPLALRVAIAAAVLAAVALLAQWQYGGRASERAASGATLAALAQSIPLEAAAAARGGEKSFDDLAASRAALVDALAAAGLTDDPAWTPVLEQSQAVLDGRATALAVAKAAGDVRELTPQVISATANVARAMGAARPDAFTRQLDRFELRARSIEQDLAALGTGAPVDDAARRLGESLEYMGQVVGGLVGETNPLGITAAQGPAADAARLLAAVFKAEQEQVRAAIASTDPLEQLAAAAAALSESGPKAAAQVSKAGAGAPGWATTPWLPLAFVVLAIAALGFVVVLQRSLATLRRESDRQAEQNERNQQAILRLLDELSSLADGDLTVRASVTEDITGAIADSINYAIEALRELVTTINDSAIKLDAATRQTQALSTHLAKASSAQSKQIASASESVAEMAASTEEVSGNAERSADVARHSVDIAHKGGDAVRRTIDGMNAIRETIQETSKRIKRLGESSQEIGNIVELINDIAEQTNILALNASIQASMAGEAGRGFAVVADEVQRLAERAANATKQIEVLVRTIQADTNEAVVSMERTTTDVVGGALLAENAGAALEEIEQVSNQIASLVQNISASARQQATSSQSISRNMQVLREISSQTAESTTATSDSIGKLAELATQLRKSVAGFRLAEGQGLSVSGEYPVLRPDALAADEVERLRRVGGRAG